MNRIATLVAVLAFFSGAARAQLTIEIIGGGAIQIPIAVLPFVGESALPQSITEIVEQDLSRSGRFRAIFVGGVNPRRTETAQVNFGEWKSRLADALLIGEAKRLNDGRFEVRFRLLDVFKQSQVGGIAFTLTAAQLRLTAHKIADFVYEKLTGERGVFSTRIAYIVKQGPRYELRVADADGQNAQSILISPEPNRSPAWSPDGKQLAAVLTKDGTSQVYLMNADGTNLRRITFSDAIDTEPFFTPDGQSIYFTSDRGGSPQIYRMPAGGGEPVRVTFEGDYNVSPRVSHDGKILAYISRVNGRFQVMAMDLDSKQVQTLTDGPRDESPSFAPIVFIILSATDNDNRGVLAAVSSDGRFKQRLGIQAADVREPSWGPFLGN